MTRHAVSLVRFRAAAIVVALASVLSWPVLAQDSGTLVSGRVVDATAGSPIAAVQVFVDKHLYAATGSDGLFAVAGLTTGSHIVTVRRLGYEPLEFELTVVPLQDSLELEIRLSPIALQLDPIVTNREALPLNRDLIGFQERKKAGIGEFVTREELLDWDPSTVFDVLRRVPNVSVSPNPDYGRRSPWTGEVDHRRFVVRSRRFAGRLGGEPCHMAVFQDGVQVGTTGPGESRIEDLIPVIGIAAIEVYAGPGEVPARFNVPGASCGVLVFWTRIQ